MWLTDGREVALGRLWKFLSLRADAAEPRFRLATREVLMPKTPPQ